MSSSLSLCCSFLDLTDEDSGYVSSTSSLEDEPLDSQVLPLPRKQSLLGRRKVYHNESSIYLTGCNHNFGESALLALSDIPWPLPNYETWLNPVAVSLSKASSNKTQPTLSARTFSTRASRVVVTIGAQHQAPKVPHAGSPCLTLGSAFESEISPTQKKTLSTSEQRRSKLEAFRETLANSFPSLPPMEETTWTSSPLLLSITHTSPFITPTEMTSSSPSKKKSGCVTEITACSPPLTKKNEESMSELSSPWSFSKKTCLEIKSETKRIIPKFSIISSTVNILDEEVNNQSVKRHQSMQTNRLKVISDRINKKSNSSVTVNRRRTRTCSSFESGTNKENQIEFHFPLKSFGIF